MAVSDLLSPPLSRLRARYAQTSLPRFFAWWGGELRACLPARWRKLLSVEDAQILLQPLGEELSLQRMLGDEVREVSRVPLAEPEAVAAALGEEQAELPRVLLVPQAVVLRRVLTLPAAALDNLRTVLGFELDRQTPFKPDQVVFDSRVLPHEAGAKMVPVELALVPRDRLQQALAALGPLAATLGAVDIAGSDGRRRGYNFLPPEQRRSRSNARWLLHAGLVAAIVLFLLIAMGRLLDNRAAAVAALGDESDAVQREARAVAKLRDSLEDAAEAANFLAVEKSRQPSMVLLLDDLTRRLPDDTWLERLSFARGEVSLSGQSGQAAKLLEILQESKLLRSSALSGPIQPDARSGKDRFNITAGYGPEPEAPTEADDASDARR